MVRKVPAVAITGYDMEDDVARIRAAGFVAHLTKPAIVPQLNELIATLSLDSLSVDSSIAERTGGPSPLLA